MISKLFQNFRIVHQSNSKLNSGMAKKWNEKMNEFKSYKNCGWNNKKSNQVDFTLRQQISTFSLNRINAIDKLFFDGHYYCLTFCILW